MKKTLTAGLAVIVLTAVGCEKNENKRLAELAERNSDRMLQQSEQMADL